MNRIFKPNLVLKSSWYTRHKEEESKHNVVDFFEFYCQGLLGLRWAGNVCERVHEHHFFGGTRTELSPIVLFSKQFSSSLPIRGRGREGKKCLSGEGLFAKVECKSLVENPSKVIHVQTLLRPFTIRERDEVRYKG